MKDGEADEVMVLCCKLRLRSLRCMCEDLGAAVSRNRETLILRIRARVEGLGCAGWVDSVQLSEALSQVRKRTLQQMCSDVSVSIGGTKESLIQRLVCCLTSEAPTCSNGSDSSSSCESSAPADPANECPLVTVPTELTCERCGKPDREDEMVLCDA